MRSERALLALAGALSAASIVLLCYRPSGQEDVWWTLAVGDYIRTHGDVPRSALWTIDAVRDVPYVCHSWLAALAFSIVADAFGVDAVPWIPTLIALAVFASIIALARQLRTSWLLSVTVADLVLWHVIRRMNCRAEIFGYLYFGLALNLIAAYLRTQRTRYLAALIVVALLWVNSHGSFPLLLMLLPTVAAGAALDAWRRCGFRRGALFASLFSRSSAELGATWLLIAATTLINPYGIDLVREILEPGSGDSLTQYIQEWAPLYAAKELPGFFFVSLAVLLAALAIGYRRISFVSLLVAPCAIALWLWAPRHVAFFGIAAAFVLADLAAGLELDRRGRTALAASLVAGLFAVHVWYSDELYVRDRSLFRNPSPDLTAKGLAFIRTQVRGNVLNSYSLGGVLIYYAYPRVLVSMDARAGPYPPAYFRSYLAAIYGKQKRTRTFVNRHAIDHIIVTRETYRKHFRAKPAVLREFYLAYRDERTVVLSRR